MIDRAKIQAIVGYITSWTETDKSVQFKCDNPVTLEQLVAISAACDTDRINFATGRSGEPGYSSWTPSCSAEPGYVEVFK